MPADAGNSAPEIVMVSTQNVPTNAAVELPIHIYSGVFKFLASRDLLSLLSSSKAIRNTLTYCDVIPRLVLRLSAKALPRQSLDGIYEAVLDCRIYCPSPIRLLRVSLGLFCEIPHCSNKVQTVKKAFGLFVCKTCRETKGSIFRSYRSSSLTCVRIALLSDKRVASCNFKSKWIVSRGPLRTMDGKFIGPLVTDNDLEQMNSDEDLETLITKRLKREGRPHNRQAFVDAYKASCELAVEAAKAIGLLKISRARQLTIKRRLCASKQLLRTAGKLSKGLAPALVNHFWFDEEASQRCTVDSQMNCHLRFDCEPLNELLGLRHELIRAQNSMTLAHLTSIVTKCLSEFMVIFPDASFLGGGTAFERSLKNRVRACPDLILKVMEKDRSLLRRYGPLQVLGCVLNRFHNVAPEKASSFVGFAHSVFYEDSATSLHSETTEDTGFVENLWQAHFLSMGSETLLSKCSRTFELVSRTVRDSRR